MVNRMPQVGRFSIFLILIVACYNCLDVQAQSSKSQAGTLPGLLPTPQQFPGLGRWQLMTKSLRGFVPTIAWSPDGNRIAFGEMHHIRICDAKTLNLIHVLVGHQGKVTSLAWAPDESQLLASSGADGTVRLWTPNGAPLRVVTKQPTPISQVAFNPLGTQLATAGDDGVVRQFDLQGKELQTFHGHVGPVRCVTWEPDELGIASGGDDHTVRLWNLGGAPAAVLEGHYGPVVSIDWSPDGTTLVSASRGVDAPDPEQRPEVLKKWGTEGIPIHPVLRMWHADGTPYPELTGHDRDITCVTWDSISHRFATVSEDRSVRIWLRNGKLENSITLSTFPDQAAAWDPDGEMLAIAGRYKVQIVDPTDKAQRDRDQKILHLGGEPHLEFSELGWKPDSKKLATVGRDRKIRIWNSNGTSDITFSGNRSAATALAWGLDGEWLATGGYNRQIQLWREDGSPGPILKGHHGYIESLAWQPGGELLASACGTDASVRLWNRDGSLEKSLEFSDKPVFAVVWSPDGERLAAGDEEGTIQIWSTVGKELFRHETHNSNIDSLAWSPDGTRLASGHNGPLRIWSVDDREQDPLVLEGHFESVMSIDWSSDSQRLVSGGWDKTVRVWNADGTAESILYGHDSPVFSVGWSPDGKWIASASYDRTLQVRNAEDSTLAWLVIVLDEGSTVTFGADGTLIDGDPAAVEQGFIHLVEKPDGSMEMLTPREFQQRVEQAKTRAEEEADTPS